MTPEHFKKENDLIFHLPFPFTEEHIFEWIRYWKENQRSVLSAKSIFTLLKEASVIFHDYPTVVDYQVNDNFTDKEIGEFSNRKLNIIGDIHGQFQDLLSIFKLNGYPSTKNPYLFNGDIVDRGKYSVECFCTILMFKIFDINSILLCKGNHEALSICSVYGFKAEIYGKYPLTHDKVFGRFIEFFDILPVAHVINKDIFVVHGGLPPEIDDLAKIREISKVADTWDAEYSGLVWADPMVSNSIACRILGVRWPFEHTAKFLSKNDLSLIIRSHQYKDTGFAADHNERVLTLFSAPQYNLYPNDGAFGILSNDMFTVYQFNTCDNPTTEIFSCNLALLREEKLETGDSVEDENDCSLGSRNVWIVVVFVLILFAWFILILQMKFH
eukprot:TRINITY_DN2636_c0_g1_i1.p1 TRINITY_DN2636_c0_g1~~TRINITY_DN2636_c0_g1_i1.p1  ORF type:complete len:385 (+),score=100.24 TRINITY_DN2636_c0_g1_i1:82-1236(+)